MFQFAVLSYNHPEITSRCLNSLKSFGFPIVLVHNGSENKHVATLKKNFAEVEHIVVEKNVGFAAGANLAIEKCVKPWIYFFTNDTELLALPSLPEQPGLYGPTLFRKDKTTIESIGGIYNLKTGQLSHLKVQKKIEPLEAFFVPGHAFLIHKSLFLKFDSDFFTYLEDVDLSLRLQKENRPIKILSDFRVSHLGGKTCRRHRKYSGFYFQRNRLILLKKYSPTPIRSQVLWLFQLVKRALYFIWSKDWVGLRFSIQLFKELVVRSFGSQPQSLLKPEHSNGRSIESSLQP